MQITDVMPSAPSRPTKIPILSNTRDTRTYETPDVFLSCKSFDTQGMRMPMISWCVSTDWPLFFYHLFNLFLISIL